VCVSGVVWEHEGVGVAVAAVEWDEDAGEIRLQPDKAEESQLLLGGKQPDRGRHSAVGGRAGAPEDAREGHLSAEQPLHRAYPHEPQRPVRGQLPARQPWPLRQAAGSLP
jgi:hypothetical protein